ncbi:SPOR domain-containing protein [Siphonobacter sp. SORGH_AS_1065]|uniref:SPOR domain-containing protein n=1 Tax=Siphonobacter sp. SORGH_AS_1065 TaxID=3041795 RepID=UPI00277FBF4E|nr:SPOR domain-containing protein [Siphonobacter sp. SORGH_AS_1065]MDQ1086568.1 hypothetical protein [Siphonobacter sp. SORGH_AS_1065]
MKSSVKYLCFLLVITLSGCASKVLPSSSSKAYTLDLNTYRPTYNLSDVKEIEKTAAQEKNTPVTPAIPVSTQPLNINKKLDTILDTMAQRNKAAKYIAGYRIQLYTGTKRNELEAAKLFIYQRFADLNTYIAYNHPTYRLRVGDFATRLDVERYFNKIKDDYPTATIITDRVTLRDALKIMDNRAADKDELYEP